MSRLLLFTAIAVTAFSSCSVYRSGQTKTPDDVYYSPAREGAAYVETEKKRDGYYQADEYHNSYDDRWLRMRVRDRYRWSAFDDYDWNYNNSWAYSPYAYNSYSWGLGFNNYWNNFYRWNSYYNPYCGGIIIVNPKVNQPVYTAVRNFSLDRYTNTNYNNANRPLSASKTGLRYSSPGYNNSNSRTTNNSLGSSIRKVFSNGNSNSGSGSGRNTYYSPGSSSDRPVRTYTPSESSSSSRSYTPSSSSSSSSSSGSSSSGSSGGGGVSRPSRGN